MSKAMRNLMMLAVVQLAASSALAVSPIRLTLTLDPPETPPGIPVSFHVEAANTSSSPAAMPEAMGA